jgi:hypothetical protein
LEVTKQVLPMPQNNVTMYLFKVYMAVILQATAFVQQGTHKRGFPCGTKELSSKMVTMQSLYIY